MSGHEGRVRVMPRTWAGGVKPRSIHPCKPTGTPARGQGAAGSCPQGSAKKGHFSVKVWGCTALGSGFKGDIRAGVKGAFQHS